MTSGADLFVVCKQCGSEVSPYITECPYCGNRLRRRAPKLPRAGAPARPPRRSSRLRSLLRGREGTQAERVGAAYRSSRWEATRPYATTALVATAVGVWIAAHAWPPLFAKLWILGPLHGDWWRLFGYQLIYGSGPYEFATVLAIALFGWLLERRHGPAVVLALFLGAGAAGALVSLAVYPIPFLLGGNAGALALLAAWAVPDLRAARSGGYYEGDLIGCAVIAALLLALPFVVYGSGWLAGVTGAVIGLAVGAGLHRFAQAEL
jgi:membrane associated rhomboid family serine protease